jgi:hypothetical protein
MARALRADLLVSAVVGAMRTWVHNFPAAGIFFGPFSWALSTQANYAAVDYFCAHNAAWVALLACLVLACLSLAGALISARSQPSDGEPNAQTRGFLSLVGALTGGLFALVICLQGAGALALSGCER